MKNKKFTALFLTTMLLLSCIVTGCGKSITPKECAQVWWEISTKDMSNVSKINMKEDEVKADFEKGKEQSIKALKSTYTAQGLTVTDEQIEQVLNVTDELAKKANVTIEEVSNDGKTAQVKYKTTYVDTTKLGTKAANDAVKSVQALGLTNQKEVNDKYVKVFIENLVNEFKNATFSEDTKEQTYTFTKQDKIWAPKDKEAFTKSLGALVAGQVQ